MFFISCSVTKKSKKAMLKPVDIKLYKNKEVDKWIDYFSVRDRERFKRFLQRGSYYEELILSILEKESLPPNLYYLPLIESGFNYKAHSHAGAVGPWQFIKSTGGRYGLTINSKIDERRDPILSTQAATKYLQDLFNVFNSWELALAAYNCGETRVLRAIMRGGTRDFWELAEKKLLPRETRNYVPKFLAAAWVGTKLKKFNMNETNSNIYPDVESVEVPGGTALPDVAKAIETDIKELRVINPSLITYKIPRWVKDLSIWIPAEKKDLYLSKVKALKGRRNFRRVSNYQYYFVRRHDFLGKIAKKFRIGVNYLKKLNGLHSNRI